MAKRRDDLLTQLLSGLTVRGILLHPATLFAIASMVTIGGAVHLWNEHQEIIVDQEDYQLTEEKIRMNSQPDWSELDLKGLVLKRLVREEGVSLLDTDLVAKTVETIRAVGCVEKVRKVEKSKRGLDIDLIYRNPVGMVELNRTTIPAWPKTKDGQLLPVDRQAVIMPGKLVAQRPLLRFSIFNPIRFTKLETWTCWPDERIQGCAEISEALGSRWEPMGFYRIVTFRKPESDSQQKEAEGSDVALSAPPFELWPASGIQVIWGNPPGQEADGEAPADRKIAALEAFVAKYGPLNKLAKGKIDVRSGKAISSTHTAELLDSAGRDFNRK